MGWPWRPFWRFLLLLSAMVRELQEADRLRASERLGNFHSLTCECTRGHEYRGKDGSRLARKKAVQLCLTRQSRPSRLPTLVFVVVSAALLLVTSTPAVPDFRFA